VGLYSVMEARHERQANRALFERANFMTMVASGHRGTFIAAMKTFGLVQTMTVPGDPALLDPWTWWARERPNEAPLHAWALAFFPLCTAEACGRPDQKPPWRIDLGGAFLIGADLIGANLEGAVLMGAFLIRANLIATDLSGVNLHEADLRGADLRGAVLREAALDGADLRAADLRGVLAFTQAQLDRACVDDTTQLPEGLTRPPPCPRLSWPIPGPGR
jgi:uncharacterized protein YjbI with pentapeptide repeats